MTKEWQYIKWYIIYSFWLFMLIMCISSFLWLDWLSSSVTLNFHVSLEDFFVSLSCSSKPLVFALSWLTCSEDPELLHTMLRETWSATSTYSYATLPGDCLRPYQNSNFSSKTCTFTYQMTPRFTFALYWPYSSI